MAASIDTHPVPSWNPLRCAGTDLPANVLLAVKLIALSLLLSLLPAGNMRPLTDPFPPFVPIFGALAASVVFEWTLRIAFLAAALALLFNRRVRLSCLLLGGTILAAALSSSIYGGPGWIYGGLFLLLAGMQSPGAAPRFLRWLAAATFFGAGLYHLLDPDWRSGEFFEYWTQARPDRRLYAAAASWFPPAFLSKLMAWSTITACLGLAAGFSLRRLYPAAIWGAILLAAAMLLFNGGAFSMFSYAAAASLLVFVEWPKRPALVLYDGDCAFCEAVKRRLERFDLDGLFVWRPYQSGAGERLGLSAAALERSAHLVVGERTYQGFAAFKMMALYNPLSYFAAAVLFAAPGAGPSLARSVLAVSLVLVFSPPLAPLGEAVYNLIARNRHRIPAKDRCRVG